jgi:hypothetical protein
MTVVANFDLKRDSAVGNVALEIVVSAARIRVRGSRRLATAHPHNKNKE